MPCLLKNPVLVGLFLLSRLSRTKPPFLCLQFDEKLWYQAVNRGWLYANECWWRDAAAPAIYRHILEAANPPFFVPAIWREVVIPGCQPGLTVCKWMLMEWRRCSCHLSSHFGSSKPLFFVPTIWREVVIPGCQPGWLYANECWWSGGEAWRRCSCHLSSHFGSSNRAPTIVNEEDNNNCRLLKGIDVRPTVFSLVNLTQYNIYSFSARFGDILL
jgi:hypothetical protein